MRARESDLFGRVVFRPPPLRVKVRRSGFNRFLRIHVGPPLAGVPQPFVDRGGPDARSGPTWRSALLFVAAFLVCISTLQAAITAVGPINLVVGDLDRQVAFYTQVLPFEQVGPEVHAAGPEIERLHAVPGARTRTVTLRLGEETITLTQFVAAPGREIPADSRSFDHWFQHIAIVVRDMDEAYAQLARHKVRHVSTAPQTLPDWNPNAGGIKAFYFQDPEQHVLEIIWFPPDKGDPRWQQPTSRLFLGIDHTAIVVHDTDRSLAFYRGALGLTVAGGAENFGTEQEHLNQVFGARLRITALRAPQGPGIEFLEYIAPPGGRLLPADARANDRLAWSITLATDTLALDGNTAIESGGRAVSAPGGERELIRDPDGHLLRLQSVASGGVGGTDS